MDHNSTVRIFVGASNSNCGASLGTLTVAESYLGVICAVPGPAHTSSYLCCISKRAIITAQYGAHCRNSYGGRRTGFSSCLYEEKKEAPAFDFTYAGRILRVGRGLRIMAYPSLPCRHEPPTTRSATAYRAVRGPAASPVHARQGGAGAASRRGQDSRAAPIPPHRGREVPVCSRAACAGPHSAPPPCILSPIGALPARSASYLLPPGHAAKCRFPSPNPTACEQSARPRPPRCPLRPSNARAHTRQHVPQPAALAAARGFLGPGRRPPRPAPGPGCPAPCELGAGVGLLPPHQRLGARQRGPARLCRQADAAAGRRFAPGGGGRSGAGLPRPPAGRGLLRRLGVWGTEGRCEAGPSERAGTGTGRVKDGPEVERHGDLVPSVAGCGRLSRHLPESPLRSHRPTRR